MHTKYCDYVNEKQLEKLFIWALVMVYSILTFCWYYLIEKSFFVCNCLENLNTMQILCDNDGKLMQITKVHLVILAHFILLQIEPLFDIGNLTFFQIYGIFMNRLYFILNFPFRFMLKFWLKSLSFRNVNIFHQFLPKIEEVLKKKLFFKSWNNNNRKSLVYSQNCITFKRRNKVG